MSLARSNLLRISTIIQIGVALWIKRGFRTLAANG